MEIVLLRHGRPDFHFDNKLRIAQLPAMVEQYNQAGVSQAAPAESCEIARECQRVVCSDLPRSLQSAQLLGVEQIHVSDALFREADIPVSIWPSPRMRPYFWFAFFRLLWLMGHSADGESKRMAGMRAEQGMQSLAQLAEQHGRVLLVGHGVLNHFIAKSLLANGWQGPGRPARHYWGYSIYRI